MIEAGSAPAAASNALRGDADRGDDPRRPGAADRRAPGRRADRRARAARGRGRHGRAALRRATRSSFAGRPRPPCCSRKSPCPPGSTREARERRRTTPTGRSFAPRYPGWLTLPVLVYDADLLPRAARDPDRVLAREHRRIRAGLLRAQRRQLPPALGSALPRHLQDDAGHGRDRNGADAARRLSDGLLDGALPQRAANRSR